MDTTKIDQMIQEASTNELLYMAVETLKHLEQHAEARLQTLRENGARSLLLDKKSLLRKYRYVKELTEELQQQDSY